MVQGRYEVLERLAEGGMGVVYKVYDRTLEVRRVMKLVPNVRQQLAGVGPDAYLVRSCWRRFR